MRLSESSERKEATFAAAGACHSLSETLDVIRYGEIQVVVCQEVRGDACLQVERKHVLSERDRS